MSNLLSILILLSSVYTYSQCPKLTMSKVDVTCYGGSNGKATFSVSCPDGPCVTKWNHNGSSASTITVSAGTYVAYTVDKNGCTSTNAISVEEPLPVVGNATAIDAKCHGTATGSVTVVPSGGNGGYSVSWSNGGSGITQTSVSKGTYKAVITDSKGCKSSSSFANSGIIAVVGEPSTSVSVSLKGTNVSCFNGSDGRVDLSGSGGTPPYTYNWNNGAKTEDLENIKAGNYSVVMTDNNGCKTNASKVITQPTKVKIQLSSTPVSCFEGSDGTASSVISGGTPPYEYYWTNSAFFFLAGTKNITNQPAGTYHLRITDSKGCVETDSVTIIQPTKLKTKLTPTHILCHGDNTGAVKNEPSGATKPYTYKWKHGSTSQNLNNILAGEYLLTITDANGCTLEDSITLIQPKEPLSSYFKFEIPSCYGLSDGKIEFNVEGGTFPYDYEWNRGDTVPNIYKVNAGKYIVTVTDNHKCTHIDSITIGQPTEITLKAKVKNVSCYGHSDGEIDLTVEGSHPEYSYNWINSNFELSVNSEDLVGYPGDTYFVEVKDSLGCSTSASFFIYEPDSLRSVLDIHDITCHSGSDGKIYTKTTGGNPGGYLYSWSNGETTKDVFNLGPDTFQVTISDTIGCRIQREGVVREPEPIFINAESIPTSCRDLEDGQIYLAPIGGWGVFHYEWSTAVTDIDSFLVDLAGGTYQTTVTDFVGCQKDTAIVVEITDEPCLKFIPSAFTPEGDGYNDVWNIDNIELYPQVDVTIFNKWGGVVFKSKGYNEPWDGTHNGSKLPSATYYYRIKISENSIDEYNGPITIVR